MYLKEDGLQLFSPGHSHILTLYPSNDGAHHQTADFIHWSIWPMVLLYQCFINALALINQRLPLFLPHMHLLSCPQLQSFGKVPVWKNLAKNKKLLKSAENLQQLKTYYLNMLVNCCSVDKGLNEKGGKVKKMHHFLPVSS